MRKIAENRQSSILNKSMWWSQQPLPWASVCFILGSWLGRARSQFFSSHPAPSLVALHLKLVTALVHFHLPRTVLTYTPHCILYRFFICFCQICLPSLLWQTNWYHKSIRPCRPVLGVLSSVRFAICIVFLRLQLTLNPPSQSNCQKPLQEVEAFQTWCQNQKKYKILQHSSVLFLFYAVVVAECCSVNCLPISQCD